MPGSRSRQVARATRSAAENARRVRALERELREAKSASGVKAEETLKSERAAWARERALLARGITAEEDVAVVSALYDRLPAKDRPEIGAWLDAQKAEPDKAPRALRPFIEEAPASKSAPAQRTPPRGAPRESSPSAGAGVTVEAIRAAGERARREGTEEARTAYRELRARAEAERAAGG